MEYTLKKGDWSNIGDGIMAEEETSPKGAYLKDNSSYFLDQTQGDLTIVYAGEEPVGVGKLTVLPDGSGWLETLRVRPAWQGKGVGKSLYAHWLLQAKERKLTHLRMFTGTGNQRSRGLAERYGFSLAGTYQGATAVVNAAYDTELGGFRPVTDLSYGSVLLESGRWEMEDFVVLNNTFFRSGKKTWAYLIENQMLFADGAHNFAVVGARMLRERGLHLAMYGGDIHKCIRFAKAYTAKQGLPKLTMSYPPNRWRIQEALLDEGFAEDAACRIVMERKI